MQLKLIKNLQPSRDGISRISCLVWSPNNRKLAACTADRVVHLFDEQGERRDRFSTKPADQRGPKNYVVTGMAWSPDSTKLAVAQSDCIVYIYKLGVEWGEKKSICNKFPEASAVTSICWPLQHPNEIIFGLAEGKVKMGILKSNKAQTLYSAEGYVVSLCCSQDGHSTLSGHVDGSVHRFCFEEAGGPSQSKLLHHTCTPQALSWGRSIVVAGNDGKVVFYDGDGQLLQLFDNSSDPDCREFACGAFNPSGESVVLGGWNRFYIYNFNGRRGLWEEGGFKTVENLFSVTSLGWKYDGSRLCIGNLTGAIDMYDAFIRRHIHRGKFLFTYVSLSQVIVKRLSSGTRIVLKSHMGYEVLKINVYSDQYLIAHTPDTLLIGDLDSCKLSEVPWSGSGSERFLFDNPHVCMVYNAGELSLVEYGVSEILGSARTEHVSSHLISVRLNECRPKDSTEDNKKIAYLIDMQTIRILDLVTGITVGTVNHDVKIDWLELNPTARKLLFRDRRRHLHLYDIATRTRTTMLNFCSYVQWVPNSDVVVAQNRENMCTWYSIDAPERINITVIKGDIEEIERTKGRTEVIVDEGIHTTSYTLDETLIEFGSCIDQRDFERAVAFLEDLELNPETEAMWQTLSHYALQDKQLIIAERCFAAVGDICKARYLRQINDIAERVSQESGGGDGYGHFMVQARLAMLDRQFQVAERLYLEQNQVDEAMDMYQDFHRWDDAIRVAESRHHKDTEMIRTSYYQWLLSSKQEEKAARLKEQEGDLHTAIQLYIQGGLPARAAVLANHPNFQLTPEIFKTIADALIRAGLHERVGEFYDKNGMQEEALQAYCSGHAYQRAIDLARRIRPREVIRLEREWGDWLAANKQLDAAVNHYIESGEYVKAIECAIAARQWTKATQIVTKQDPQIAKEFIKKIASHFAEVGNFETAEQLYLHGGMAPAAVDMYTQAGKWDKAHIVANTYMAADKVADLYVGQAQRLESSGKFKDAEKLYLMVKQPDLAINMYKKNHLYDHMIRLVTQHHPELLLDTHLHLAMQLESEANFKDAERHYVEGKEWKKAVNMYKGNDMWDDALRVAKQHGGANASKQVAYNWANYLGGEAGAKLLQKFGLIEQAIEYATEHMQFDQAFQLARSSMPSKLPDVHLKHAMFLEDEGHFKQAEDEFINANKPKEAIDMYIHQQDWLSAIRVSENHDPSALDYIHSAQAATMIQRKDYASAEALFISMKKPELAFKMYKDARSNNDALRIVKMHMPSRLHEFQHELQTALRQSGAESVAPGGGMGVGGGSAQAGGGGGAGGLASITNNARMLADQGEYSKAIDMFLRVTEQVTADHDVLEETWEEAVKLALNQVPSRLAEVVQIVSSRLMEIKRWEQAAEMFEGIDNFRQAIDVYIIAQMWDKARALAASSAPHLIDYVDNKMRQAKGGGGAIGGPAPPTNTVAPMISTQIASGNPEIQTLAEQGEWERCLQLAQKQGQESVEQYSLMHSAHLIKGGDFGGAAHVLSMYGVPISVENNKLYSKLALSIINSDSVNEQCLTSMREVVHKIVSDLKARGGKGAGPGGPSGNLSLPEWEKVEWVVHLLALRAQCVGKGEQMTVVSTKAATSLVRYCDIVAADKVFSEAGIANRAVKNDNAAFVFLNRFLDIADAMEEPDSSMALDNSEFEGTDIPFDFALPAKPCMSESKKDSIKDWVLTMSMDQKVDPQLPNRPCDKCSKPMYEACLKCPGCKVDYTPCIVTGYPIGRGQKVNCRKCNMGANKEDWNRFLVLTQSCPWCANPETAIF